MTSKILTFVLLLFSFSANAQDTTKVDLPPYPKFDFVPGEKIVFFDNFAESRDSLKKWRTNGKAEVVKPDSIMGKWIKLSNSTTYLPLINSTKFSENFTIEFDMIATGVDRSGNFGLEFTSLTDKNILPSPEKSTGQPGLFIWGNLQPDGTIMYTAQASLKQLGEGTGTSGRSSILSDWTLADKANEKFHVSISVNKQWVRYYVNHAKVLDLPNFLPLENYNAIILRLWNWSTNQPFEVLISNFRYVEGKIDIRSKIMTAGKLVTQGIDFETGTDSLKVQSYGILKEIAQVLKANPKVRIKIVGHTDADGNEAENLALSKKRAGVIKNTLIKYFKIDNTRMDTDGKGETVPLLPNTSAENKASNQRIEFIKM
jgi:OOP family OmpA-OmpF porin